MAKYTGNTLTKLGMNLLARAIASSEIITFTKVEIGKGTYTGDKEDATRLVDSFKVLPITSTTKLEGGSYRVRTAFSNSGITEDTYLKEIGVFARGEDGVEVLYSYCNTDTPDLIPAEGSGVLERVEDVITYISSATNINAVIDQSKIYATIKDLTEGLATKENKFNKNSGFNRVMTDLVTSASSIIVASAKAVKTAYDKAVEAFNLATTNKKAILNQAEQIENLSDTRVYNSPQTGCSYQIVTDIGNTRIITGALSNYVSGTTLNYVESFADGHVGLTFGPWISNGTSIVRHSGRGVSSVEILENSDGTNVFSDFTLVGIKP